SFTTVSVKATTLFAAINLLNSCIDRTINLTHTKLYIVGEELAKRDPFPFRAFSRFREVRQDIYILVAQGTAREVLDAFNPSPKTTPSKFIEVMVKNTGATGLIPTTQLKDYITKLESNSGEPLVMLIGKSNGLSSTHKSKIIATAPYVPGEIPRAGGNPVETIGAAVFRHEKMVGKLTGSENRVREYVTGEFKSGFINFPDPIQPGKYVGLEMKQYSHPKIRITFEDKVPVISVNIVAEGDLAIEQGTYVYSDPDKLKILEGAAEKHLEKLTVDVIKKCQAMGSDVFDFGDVARRNFRTWDEWNNLHWDSLFPTARVTVNMDFGIRRIGVRFEPATPGD
ncbi:MAG TPA: Ger(x)C family spore germination protein, partial [Bacillota bacterium]|nr:Ger(x)C family spore germination protein [Bacillota bacterium]